MARRYLKGFLYSVGVDAKDFPLASRLKTSFLDENTQPIDRYLNLNEYILTDISLVNFNTYLISVENRLKKGITVHIDEIQITPSAVLLNPFSEHPKLFLREV